jgi:hypothetical protein
MKKIKKAKEAKEAKEGMIKFNNEKKVISYSYTLDMDDVSEEVLYTYALNGIMNDRGAMINWAVNDILKKQIEKG